MSLCLYSANTGRRLCLLQYERVWRMLMGSCYVALSGGPTNINRISISFLKISSLATFPFNKYEIQFNSFPLQSSTLIVRSQSLWPGSHPPLGSGVRSTNFTMLAATQTSLCTAAITSADWVTRKLYQNFIHK